MRLKDRRLSQRLWLPSLLRYQRIARYRVIMNPGIGTSGRKWRGAEGSGFVNRDHDSVQVQGSDGDNDRLENSDIYHAIYPSSPVLSNDEYIWSAELWALLSLCFWLVFCFPFDSTIFATLDVLHRSGTTSKVGRSFSNIAWKASSIQENLNGTCGEENGGEVPL